MSESEEEYDELEEQLRQEKLEKERRDNCSDIEHGRQRVDPDGTVYEWDSVKMAYFPKVLNANNTLISNIPYRNQAVNL